MRPRLGGLVGEWLLKPIATHEFLNIRTYVRHEGEPGIFFLAEWLSNRISVLLGPRTFGLPYRFGNLDYRHAANGDSLKGTVDAVEGRLHYAGEVCAQDWQPCERGSRSEFMLERYTAFTEQRNRRRLFRIWHEPWPQAPAEFRLSDESLIASTGAWWSSADLIDANYSPGVDVWMGRPHRIRN
jgi:uncharacterized protein YqjF (DUF2071 family)